MSISRLMRTVQGMLAPSVRPDVEFSVDCESLKQQDWFLGDAHQTQQVLTNVVTNAIKCAVAGSVTLRAARVDNAIRLECSDTGPGIPKNDQKKIFEKFVQRGGAPGTGLGLSIAKSVVDLCGGSIYFESDPTQRPGTTCVIILPLKSCKAEFNVSAEEELAPALIEDPISVLVIDDVAINRSVLNERIKMGIAPNASVTEATNGEEALELCKKKRFDCIFVDQFYGESGGAMIGTDVVIAMRRTGIDSIILACSCSDSDAPFSEAGCDIVWGKPLPSNAVMIKQLSKPLSK